MGTTKTQLTFEEFERLPDQPGKRELVRGELIELPPAKMKHHKIAKRIFKPLDAALCEAHARHEALELGEVFHEMGYLLSRDCWVQPDVSITFANHPGEEYFEGAPAIAIEVVSPANSAADLDDKTKLYFECGAREVWLLYGKTRRAIVFADGVPRVVTADESITTPLLPGFSMRISEILGD